MNTQLLEKQNNELKISKEEEKNNELKTFTDEVTKLVIKSDPEMMKLYLLVQSGLFPEVESFKEAFVKVQAGKELGFGLFAGLKNLYIQEQKVWTYKKDEKGNVLKDDKGKWVKDKFRIEKKIGVYTTGIAALLKAHKHYNYTILKWDDRECQIIMWRDSRKLHDEPVKYTIEEAKEKGLLGKEAWKINPKQMLFYRALSKTAKQYAPDIYVFGVTTLDTEDSEPIKIENGEPEEELTKEEIIARGETAAKEL